MTITTHYGIGDRVIAAADDAYVRWKLLQVVTNTDEDGSTSIVYVLVNKTGRRSYITEKDLDVNMILYKQCYEATGEALPADKRERLALWNMRIERMKLEEHDPDLVL